VQGLFGALLSGGNFFAPWLLFVFFHYTIAWMATPANELDIIEMAGFISSAAFIVAYGAFTGLGLTYAVRIRDLVPLHTYVSEKRQPHLAAALLVFAVVIGVRGAVVRSGAINVHKEFILLDEGNEFGYMGAAIGGFALFALVLALTLRTVRKKDLWMWLTLRYRDDFHSYIITDYVVLAVLLLAPQAAWNFLVQAPHNWPSIWAGALTIGMEAAVWVSAYFWFTRVRHIDDTHFARAQSYVSFLEFCLIGGAFQAATGVEYIIMDFLPDTIIFHEEFAAAVMLAVELVAALVLYFVFGMRRKKEKGASTGDQAAPARGRDYAQLTG
jgi:hypothetical protein